MLFDPASVVSDGMERSVLDALIETAVDCMKVMHPDGTLCHMNSHGQHAMELDSLDGVGQPWSSLWPPAGAQQVEAALRAAADGRSSRFQAFCPTAKGTARWWDVAVSPVHDASGAVSRVVAVSRDVTAVAEVERAAARSRERLGAVLRAAGMGEIELDLRTGHCARSAAVDEMFGVPPGSVDGGLGPLLARIHPADRARVEAELDRSETLGEAWSSEFRIVLPDRGLRWLAGSAQVEPGADGPPGRLLGILRDITERKAGDERLRESEHWRNLALEASGIGMWDYDVRSQAVTWTAECYAIHGVEPGEFDGTATVFAAPCIRPTAIASGQRCWARCRTRSCIPASSASCGRMGRCAGQQSRPRALRRRGPTDPHGRHHHRHHGGEAAGGGAGDAGRGAHRRAAPDQPSPGGRDGAARGPPGRAGAEPEAGSARPAHLRHRA
jgi:PAS domain S-box-containing protein